METECSLEIVINLCYRLRTLFLFIVLFSTLHVSTSVGHHQVFHIYHTTTVLCARFLVVRLYNRTTKIDNSTEEKVKVVDLRHEAKFSSRILDGVL
jgi:positive regulator of sigma E activity